MLTTPVSESIANFPTKFVGAETFIRVNPVGAPVPVGVTVALPLNGIEVAAYVPSTGGGSVTVTVTVAALLSSVPSFALNVNVSSPLNGRSVEVYVVVTVQVDGTNPVQNGVLNALSVPCSGAVTTENVIAGFGLVSGSSAVSVNNTELPAGTVPLSADATGTWLAVLKAAITLSADDIVTTQVGDVLQPGALVQP